MRWNLCSPAKSFTFTSAPSLMSSLMRRASPRMAARCSRVSPRSFLLFTLSLVLEAEFGVPFWPPLDCDWCFGVVSGKKRGEKRRQQRNTNPQQGPMYHNSTCLCNHLQYTLIKSYSIDCLLVNQKGAALTKS